MNLNIEGTRHEKAILVILSYISGFTAGFIIFSLGQAPTYSPVTIFPEQLIETSVNIEVPDEVVTEEMTPSEKNDSAQQQVVYKDGRLVANINGANVLLSVQLDNVDEETAKMFTNQGVHESIPSYGVSEDGRFVYYCEQHTSVDSCKNFIYDVENQIIQYVTIDGKKMYSNSAESKNAYWEGSILHIANMMSTSTQTPWKLVSAQ